MIQDEVSLGHGWVAEPQWRLQGPQLSPFLGPAVLNSQLGARSPNIIRIQSLLRGRPVRGSPKAYPPHRSNLRKESFPPELSEKSWEEDAHWPTSAQWLRSEGWQPSDWPGLARGGQPYQRAGNGFLASKRGVGCHLPQQGMLANSGSFKKTRTAGVSCQCRLTGGPLAPGCTAGLRVVRGGG